MVAKLKSVLKWLFIVLLTLVLGFVAALVIYKDKIIAQVLVEVNKSLQVPVQVNKVDIEFLHGFPNVAIRFNEVLLPANGDDLFLEAGKIYVILNPFDLLQGEFTIARIEVADARINVYVDKDNRNNFSKVFTNNRQETADSLAAATRINLQAIILSRVEVNYTDLFTGTKHHWLIKRLQGDFSLQDNVYAVKIKGSLTLNDLVTRTWEAKRQRDLIITANVNYTSTTRLLQVLTLNLQNEGASFTITGQAAFGAQPQIDLVATGNKVTLALLASYLPPRYARKLQEYKSKGTINFDLALRGKVTRTSLPALQGKVQFKNVDLTDRAFKANINNLHLLAEVAIADIGNLATAHLNITGAKGMLGNQPFELNLAIDDFLHPRYRADFKGKVTTGWVLADMQFPYHKTAAGTVAIDLRAAGKFAEDGRLQEADLSGSFRLNDVAFKWSDSVTIDRVKGTIQFNGDNLSLSNMQVKWLQSDVVINGSVEDISRVVDKSGDLLLISDVRSQRLAIEDIVALIVNAPVLAPDSLAVDTSEVKLNLQLACRFNDLTFKRFRGRNIAGEVAFEDNLLEVIDFSGRSMGGATRITGKLKFMPNKDIYISADAKTRGVNLDSLFYVFNNFQQDFITDKHLKGKLYADITASMYFDSTWRFRRPLLTSRAKIKIVGGELNDFAPIMALSAYINDKDDNLSRLRFSDLTNYITVKEDTVFIPEMSIQTNVRNIALAGYHTLDQHINYRLAVPVISERVDKDETFGTVQKSSKGVPNLLFKIKGTTSDYKVNYDLKRATGNVLKLLDITKIFKQKATEPVDSSFLDEEEFEWEN